MFLTGTPVPLTLSEAVLYSGRRFEISSEVVFFLERTLQTQGRVASFQAMSRHIPAPSFDASASGGGASSGARRGWSA